MSVRNVVVIGAGLAGANVAKILDKSLPPTHRVVLIEKRDYYFHIIAALRAAAVDDISDSIMIPLDKLLKKGKVVHTNVTKVNAHDVEIQPVGEWGERIPFDYLIFATGASWTTPILVPQLKADGMRLYKDTRDAVAAAEKIVVIGGGAVGCELVGEIKDKYPNKTVTLIHNQSLPITDLYPIKFRESMRDQMANMGVTLMLGERVDNLDPAVPIPSPTVIRTVSGKEVPADLTFVTIGARANTSLATTLDPAVVTPNGIRVLPTFQLDNPSYSHIFAIGDVADLKEVKQAFKAPNHGNITANNIVALIKGNSKKLKNYTPPAIEAIVVPLGKKQGAGVLPMFGGAKIGPKFTSAVKGKELFVSKARASMNYK